MTTAAPVPSTAQQNFLTKYLLDTPYQQSIPYYLGTIPPRKNQSDKQLVATMSRILLRGMTSDTPYPVLTTFTIVSDFEYTVINAAIITDSEGTVQTLQVKLPQYMTALANAKTPTQLQNIYAKFALESITALAGEIK